jgi:hypothetical protein
VQAMLSESAELCVQVPVQQLHVCLYVQLTYMQLHRFVMCCAINVCEW